MAENPRNSSLGGIDGESAIGRPKRDIRPMDNRIETRPSNATDSRGNVKDGQQPRNNGARGGETITPRPNDSRDVSTPSTNEPRKNTGSDEIRSNPSRSNQDVVPGTRNNPASENPRGIQPANPRQDGPRETSPNSPPRNPQMNNPRDGRPNTPGNTNPRTSEPSNPKGNEYGQPRNQDTRTEPSGNPRGNEFTPAPANSNEPRMNAPRGNEGPSNRPDYNNSPRNDSSPRGGEEVKPRKSSQGGNVNEPRNSRRSGWFRSNPSEPSKSGGTGIGNTNQGGSRPSVSPPSGGGSRGSGAPSGGSSPSPRRGR